MKIPTVIDHCSCSHSSCSVWVGLCCLELWWCSWWTRSSARSCAAGSAGLQHRSLCRTVTQTRRSLFISTKTTLLTMLRMFESICDNPWFHCLMLIFTQNSTLQYSTQNQILFVASLILFIDCDISSQDWMLVYSYDNIIVQFNKFNKVDLFWSKSLIHSIVESDSAQQHVTEYIAG